MNVARLLTSTALVTLVKATGAVDGFGDPTNATTTKSFKCWLSQQQRSELTANENTQQETWALYLEPAALDVTGFDRVTVDGITYEFEGPPWPARNPRTGQLTHLECTVRRTR